MRTLLYVRRDFLLYALSEKNIYVNAKQATRDNKYICPGCQKKLILRQGKAKVPHFAHHKFQCNIFSEGESSEHLQGKNFLMEISRTRYQKVELEAYLSDLKQKPDILVNNQIAFEFQCSPISVQKMVSRSKGYKKKQLRYFWFLGKRHFLKRKMTQQIAQFLRWHSNLGFYLIYIDVAIKKLVINYNIQVADFLDIKYKRYETTNFDGLERLFNQKKLTNTYSLNLIQQNLQFQRLRIGNYKSTGIFRDMQRLVYENGLIFEKLIPILVQRDFTYPIFQQYHFVWQLKKMLNKDANEALYQLPFINLEKILLMFESNGKIEYYNSNSKLKVGFDDKRN